MKIENPQKAGGNMKQNCQNQPCSCHKDPALTCTA